MKPYKKDVDFSYSIGVFPTLELLETHPEKVRKVWVSSRGYKNEGVEKIRTICCEKGIPIEQADETVDRIAQNENSYAVAAFSKYVSSLDNSNHLVLVNPSDKGNLGTIIRTMIAYDMKNLAIIKPGADIFDPKTIRASMGALFKINFQYFTSFDEYRSYYRHSLYPFMTNGKESLNHIKFARPFSLIFGNEGAGLSEEYLKVGTTVRIPQGSQVDSLNLSVAVGIALYAQKNLGF